MYSPKINLMEKNHLRMLHKTTKKGTGNDVTLPGTDILESRETTK